MLEIAEETHPCSRMEKAYDGLRQTLGPEWRGGGAMLGALPFGLSIIIGLGLISMAQRLFALPDAWELQMMSVMIASVINEGTLLKLLYHRTRNALGS